MGITDERALWLASHVLPLEAGLRGWLRRSHQPDFEIDDIIQEAYAKLATAPDVSGIRNVKAYVYRTAYSVMVSRLRRKSVVSIQTLADLDILQTATDDASPEEQAIARNELQLLMQMLGRLPDKTRRIFLLSRVSGLSQKEIVRETGYPESTVEKHIAKGFSLLISAYSNGGFEPITTSRKRNQGFKRANGRADKPGS
ncbi:RNA polymerase sigma factor [Brevundimonas naejangsanensis]|jgi:RNA polymerase sigma factor (sigma-70 family)